MAPAVESDGLRYHLTAAQEWLRAEHFVLLPYSANSNLPSLLSLLTASTNLFNEAGRTFQLLHALHFVALALICGRGAQLLFRHLTFGEGHAAPARRTHAAIAGAGTALLVASAPVTMTVGAWPFSDVASATYLLAALVVAIPATERRGGVNAVAFSAFLGACVATKLSSAPLAIGVFLIGVWRAFPLLKERRNLSAILPFVLPGALVISPWLIKNYLYHGNPLYPLAWGTLGGPEWSELNDLIYRERVASKGVGRDLLSLVKSPWNVTAHWTKFESHNPGPIVLSLLPAVLAAGVVALRRRLFFLGATVALFFFGWLVWFFTYQSVRFLIPHLALMAVIGVPVLYWAALNSGRRWVIAVRVAVALLAFAGAVRTILYNTAIVPVYQAAVGSVGETAYITARFATYPALQWLNENTVSDEPVFYIGEHRGFYASHFKPILSDWFDTPRVLVEIRSTPNNLALFEKWRGEGIRYVLINQAELSLYEDQAFRPRFTPEEWQRFTALREELLKDIAYTTGNGIYVVRVP